MELKNHTNVIFVNFLQNTAGTHSMDYHLTEFLFMKRQYKFQCHLCPEKYESPQTFAIHHELERYEFRRNCLVKDCNAHYTNLTSPYREAEHLLLFHEDYLFSQFKSNFEKNNKNCKFCEAPISQYFPPLLGAL